MIRVLECPPEAQRCYNRAEVITRDGVEGIVPATGPIGAEVLCVKVVHKPRFAKIETILISASECLSDNIALAR